MSDIFSTKVRPFIQLANKAEEVSIDGYKNQLDKYVLVLKKDFQDNYGTLTDTIDTLTPDIVTFAGGASVTLTLEENKLYTNTGDPVQVLNIGSNYPKTSPYETLIFFTTVASGTPSIVFPEDFVSLNPDGDWVLEAESKYVISLLYGVFAIKKLVTNTVS